MKLLPRMSNKFSYAHKHKWRRNEVQIEHYGVEFRERRSESRKEVRKEKLDIFRLLCTHYIAKGK